VRGRGLDDAAARRHGHPQRIAATDAALIDQYRAEGLGDLVIWPDQVWPAGRPRRSGSP
jgi:hypothetical protein